MPSRRRLAPLRPPSSNPGADTASVGTRLRKAIMKPVDPEAASSRAAPGESRPVEELEVAARSANDKERLVGLLAAPFAAAIGFLVISALIVNDPPALLRSGQLNKLHVAVSLYYDLGAVLLALSVLILATAMLRKRLFLGIVMALYGLAVFNLHYWGFGIPFIMGGAWLLVRAYRLQRDLREATGDGLTVARQARSGTSRTSMPPARPPSRRPAPSRAKG